MSAECYDLRHDLLAVRVWMAVRAWRGVWAVRAHPAISFETRASWFVLESTVADGDDERSSEQVMRTRHRAVPPAGLGSTESWYG